MIELPQGWEIASLGDVSSVIRGVTFPASAKEPLKNEGNVCCLRTSNIQKEIDWKDVYFVSSEFVKREEQLVRVGDILMSMANSYELVGKVAVVRELPFTTAYGAFLAAIRPTEAIYGRYLFHWLRTNFVQVQLRKGSSQTTNIANISASSLAEIKIPLAPLAEQKRIADKIDALLARVDATRAKFDRVPSLLKQFRQSVLAAAFTGKLTKEFCRKNRFTPVSALLAEVQTPPRPNRFSSKTEEVIDGDYALAVGMPKRMIPQDWQWTPLVDVARMESGHTPSRSHPEYWGGEIDWIGIADARDWHGKTIPATHQKTNEEGILNSAARLLPKDTICLSRTASVGYVVKMGKSMATSQDFVNWTCTAALEPEWLKYLFMAETAAIYRFGKGSTHTTVYFPELLALHVALPPIEEQREIVRRIEALFALADKVESRYEAARVQVDNLTPALLATAFRGDLVPQDPSDEPADQLLARLRAKRDTAPAAPRRGRKVRKNMELA